MRLNIQFELRQLHVTCNVHPPVQRYHCHGGEGGDDDDIDDHFVDDNDHNFRFKTYSQVRHNPINVATTQKSDQA